MQLNNKEILMTNESLLTDIQSAFTACYPFLKIDFIKPDKAVKTLISEKIDPCSSLKQFSNANLLYKLDINNHRTVSQVSDDIKSTLGVIVQMSRKSGKVWNAISFTDGWTLETQNSEGEFISSIMDVPAIKAIEDKSY